MKVFLIVTIVATLLRYTEGSSFGDHLLTRLKTDVYHMNNLISLIKHYYREGKKIQLDSDPTNYEDALNSGTAAVGKARKLIGNIEAGQKERADDRKNKSKLQEATNGMPSSRRSNTDLQFTTNFYKALSRALKQEFPDNPLIQEHVHDGFIPPTTMNPRY